MRKLYRSSSSFRAHMKTCKEIGITIVVAIIVILNIKMMRLIRDLLNTNSSCNEFPSVRR